MIIGNPDIFAIESQIDVVDADTHFLAWGSFALRVTGQRYGVWEEGWTSFSNSPGAVLDLIKTRGSRVQPSRQHRSAFDLADEWLDINFRDEPRVVAETDRTRRAQELMSPACHWPPMDREFDDGSTVLLFDIDDAVRIIAFENADGDVARLSEVFLPAAEFYQVLTDWHSAFHHELEQQRREYGVQPTGRTVLKVDLPH